MKTKVSNNSNECGVMVYRVKSCRVTGRGGWIRLK